MLGLWRGMPLQPQEVAAAKGRNLPAGDALWSQFSPHRIPPFAANQQAVHEHETFDRRNQLLYGPSDGNSMSESLTLTQKPPIAIALCIRCSTTPLQNSTGDRRSLISQNRLRRSSFRLCIRW